MRGRGDRRQATARLRSVTAALVALCLLAGVATAQSGRRGPVRLEGNAVSDDGGPWLALGTTLFWALWGERHDAARLERNLAFAARQGVDYVRVLSMVGSDSWRDRVIDPRWPDYWDVVDRLAARAARHGLRLQITVFADAQVMMPRADDRRAWADRWAARVSAQPERFFLLEAANEAWLNGLDDLDQLVALTERLNERTGVLVAASAPSCGPPPSDVAADSAEACAAEWRRLAAVADVMTPHLDRSPAPGEGADRAVRRPWELLFGPRTLGMRAWINNEPLGPQSSVESETDPQRLVMAAAVTWLAQGAAYTLHTGAGVRGGGEADRAMGRAANLDEVPRIAATLRALHQARRRLPAALPNCRPANAHWPEAPLAADLDDVVRVYQAVCTDGTVVALPFGVRDGATVLTARRRLEINGRVLAPGDTLRVDGPSAILVGRLR